MKILLINAIAIFSFIVTAIIIHKIKKNKNRLGKKKINKLLFFCPFSIFILSAVIVTIVPRKIVIDENKISIKTNLFDRVLVDKVVEQLNEKQENQVVGLSYREEKISNSKKIGVSRLQSKKLNILYEEHKITYTNTKGVDMSSYPSVITYADKLYLSNFEQLYVEGFTFLGWVDSSNNDVNILENVKSDIELIAVWGEQ